MSLSRLLFLALLSTQASWAGPSDVALRHVGEIARELTCIGKPTKAFGVTACVSFVARVARNTVLVLEDASGSVVAFDERPDRHPPFVPGDVVQLTGAVTPVNSRWRRALVQQAKHVARRTPPPPRTVRVADLSSGQFDYRVVRLCGTVYDARGSESNPDWLFLTIADPWAAVYANIQVSTNAQSFCQTLIGAEVVLEGICAPRELGTASRRHAGRTVKAYDLSALRVLKAPPEDWTDVPDISTLEGASADEIPLFRRYGVHGRILAVWEDQAMLSTLRGDKVRLQFVDGDKPVCGQHIAATGFPETDLFNVNLNHVSWRACDACPEMPPEAPPQAGDIPHLSQILQFHGVFQGATLRFSGSVLTPPPGEGGRMYVASGTHVVPVVVPDSLRPADLSTDCQVEVTGVCVLESERWHPNLVFPKTRGFFIVVRSPSDIRIVARPPWWTVRRLVVLVGSLFAFLVGILIWNLALRHLAARKGRELFKEQLGHVKADLRTEERTRLAVELHDTLAQNLTGVSMEIEAASDLRGTAPKPMLDHLGIAAKALKSCRDELRNCLWDLRSQALEEPDMTTAILRTLQPHVNDSQLSVRFNVPRARLSDNTAHALLRVIRELVINAIRHGNASTVKVAGTIDQGRLLCSVADNGCGFDPDNVPGILQGHFGLQGIRERIDDLGGEFSIRSSFGKGTKATISVPVPHMT